MRSHGLSQAVASFAFVVVLLPSEASAACENWTQRNPMAAPPGRCYAAEVYDSVRGVTALFGGWNGSARLNDTWEWSGSNWVQRTPATAPPARYAYAMAYDSARGVTVLFGGWGNSGKLNDTWEWNGSNWTQRTPPTSPPARWSNAMAYDSARGVVVLFGGYDPSSLSDTWEWNGTNWTQRTPAMSPRVRCDHAMAYDSGRNVTVLFGGWDSGTNTYLSDTWEWDGSNWTQRTPPTAPTTRRYHAMAYDSARGVTVLFGGWNESDPFGDTWEWNGSTWTQRNLATAPPGRWINHAMAYDSARGVVVLFGGYTGSYLNDTWEYGHGPDTDGDGIPDACDNCPQLPNPGQEDCNGNGVGDICDIASGYSQDCNGNGVPDECDIGTPAMMVLIPAGEFQMGDPWNEGQVNERPVHAVYLNSYYIGKYEVTNDQYAAGLNWAYAQGGLITVTDGGVYKYNSGYRYCDTTASSPFSRITWNGRTFGVLSGKGDHPVVTVNWYGSVAYCNWRSAMESKPLCYDLSSWTCDFAVNGYRLPTEAEWEKAAGWDPVQQRHYRFGEGTDGCGSNCFDGQRANYSGSGDPYEPGADPHTTPVGFYNGELHYKVDFGWPGSQTSYQTQNAQSYYGCYDMTGNAWEWCYDWYSDTYYSSSPSSNPTGPSSGTYGILRGGGWETNPGYCRSATRDGGGLPTRDSAANHYGLRLVLPGMTSQDCNGNGIPDECELAGNDCNSNGVPDDCDLVASTSQDCNHNGIPDECESGLIPSIVTPPGNQTVVVGQPVSLSVVATGQGTLTYQWRKGGQPLTDGGRIAGATTATLAISPSWLSDAGSYDVVVGGVCGSVTSEAATLTVTALKGDMNCDGVINYGDINPFVVALNGYPQYHAQYPNCDYYNADCDHDGYVTYGDINPFVRLLSGAQ